MFLFTLILLVIIIIFSKLFIKWITRNNDVFKKQGLKYLNPFPIIGNSSHAFNQKLIEKLIADYNKFPSEKLFGNFDFTKPIYVIKCPELLKQITVKDFSHFQDHRTFVDSRMDDLFGNVLLSLKGEQWRDMRSSLSPMFTGSKMRMMFQLIIHCCNQIISHIENTTAAHPREPSNMEDVFSRYTNDVIASCAFGVECDSFKYPNNDFYAVGQKILQVQKPINLLKLLIIINLPTISKYFGLKLLDNKTREVFKNLITNTMETRTRENFQRPDMIKLLMKLKDGQMSKTLDHEDIDFQTHQEAEIIGGSVRSNWTNTELVAQCFMFFLAGFGTSSTLMTFLAYELAMNSHVQSKLFEEIRETHRDLSGNPIDYDTLQKMRYLQLVIMETLRKWPPIAVSDRLCVKPYSYSDWNGLSFTLKEGDLIWLPIYAFHMDPNHFPNPETFDPDRFDENNRVNINMNAYMPFGLGPRSCIGYRFAFMEVKALFYHLLLNFKITICPSTQIPIKVNSSIIGLVPKGKVNLCFESRTKIG